MGALDPIPLPDVVREAQARRPAILRLVGNTPLVPIERLNPNPKVRLLAKLEGFNPGGSVKDRIGLAMIEAAEASGELVKGKTILEPTSGNTGIGLAMVAAIKGYDIVLAMSEGASIERRKILAAFGAEFILTPADQGTDGAIEVAYEMAGKEPDKYFLADQYNNPNNPLSHYYGTGVEVWEQTGGQVTHFVATIGTTGTLMGTGRRLRELNPDVRIVCVEPYLGHRIQGLKNLKEAYVPGIFDEKIVTDTINIEDEDAFEMSRRLAREEGILVGMSSGASAHVAVELAKSLKDGGVVVFVLPDGGERYLSTPLFQVAEDVKAETRLRFLNSLTRKVEAFVPLQPGKATLYSCGPTAHALPHLGLYRRIVVADLVRRTLELAGHEVEQVMNITDVDDKTIAAAEAEGQPLGEVTERHIQAFLGDVDALGVLPATRYPRASEHVDDMLAATKKLVDRGFAYEKLRSVYFNISRFPEYGRLSGVDLDKILVGATVDLERYEKDNPRDFTLLKRSTLGEIRKGISYRTEWGNVRPAWHIECAAIAMSELGSRYDIHLGGHDLLFPHHENEIAVCQALTGEQPAQTWLHSAMVTAGGKKMSHSAGNAVTVRELLDEGYSGRAVRLCLLGRHYRQPFHFSKDGLDAAVASLRRVDELVRRVLRVSASGCNADTDTAVAELKDQFTASLFDDLNVSAALAALFHFVRWANRQFDRGRLCKGDAKQILAALAYVDQVLALGPPEVDAADEGVDALLEEREEARRDQDWPRADEIREQLADDGVMVTDTPEGPHWRRETSP